MTDEKSKHGPPLESRDLQSPNIFIINGFSNSLIFRPSRAKPHLLRIPATISIRLYFLELDRETRRVGVPQSSLHLYF